MDVRTTGDTDLLCAVDRFEMIVRSCSNRMTQQTKPNSRGVAIRPLRIADYDAVVALWRRSEGVGLNESDTKCALVAYLKRNPQLSHVAEEHGRIIGAVLCGHDGRRGYLHHLAVARRHQGRGIGGKLVSACLSGLEQLGIPRCNIFVFAYNRDGQKFWKRTGWRMRADLRVMQIGILGREARTSSSSC